VGRLRLKCDGTRAETRFRLSAKRRSPFKSAGTASVHSTTGSRGVRISGSNSGYTTFRGSVKSTGYPLHSPVSPSLLLPCVTVCHHISTGVYHTVRCYNRCNSCASFVRNQTAPLQVDGNTDVAAGYSKKCNLYGNVSQNTGAAGKTGKRRCLAASNKIMNRQVAKPLYNPLS
jgi:hypothetical protein